MPVIFIRVLRTLVLTESGKSLLCKILRKSAQRGASSLRAYRHDLAKEVFMLVRKIAKIDL